MRLHPGLVLTYHAVADVDPGHDPDHLVHPPAKFRAEIESLLARGYRFVSATGFAQALRAGRSLDRTCAVTFDDGSLDNLTVAAPILREFGVPGTVFACPGLLGRPHPWVNEASGVRLMDAGELAELSRLGFFEVGSHTVDHADLDHATAEEAYGQMAASKQALEDVIDKPVLTFAYPFCRYSAACPQAAERAGYLCAFTCSGRGGWQPYELRREMMDREQSALAWKLKSRGAFDRVVDHPAARVAKAARRAVRRVGARG